MHFTLRRLTEFGDSLNQKDFVSKSPQNTSLVINDEPDVACVVYVAQIYVRMKSYNSFMLHRTDF